VQLPVSERQALHVLFPRCQAVSAGGFPSEAPSRAQYRPRLRAFPMYFVTISDRLLADGSRRVRGALMGAAVITCAGKFPLQLSSGSAECPYSLTDSRVYVRARLPVASE
jgi:hypothetical protein